jgi:hypothetical protein
MIKILQDMSAEIKERDDNYIQGAKAGLLMFNKDKSLLGESVKIIPLASKPVYVEWVPRSAGGGMVATHPVSITADSRYKKDGFAEFLGENELLYTVYWCVLMERNGEWIQAIIAMTKSQLKVSRKLAAEVANFRYDDAPDTQPPTFARIFELSTALEKNKGGDEYFNFAVAPVEEIKDEALMDTAFNSLTSAVAELPSPEPQAALVDDSSDPY